MNYRFVLAVLASILLSACGRGSEDFAFRIERPADKVEAAFGKASIGGGELASMIPGLKLVRSEPAQNEVLYTIPGDGAFEATVKLTFEPVDGGKATVLHAAIDAPRSEVTFEGKAMVISETKVELMIGKVLRKAARKLENGADIASEQREFSQILAILAIVTDSKKLRLAQDMTSYPEWYMSGFGWLAEAGDGPAGSYGDPAIPEDPGAAARREEYRQNDAEREARSKAEEASRPMDDADGDYAGPSEY